MSPSETLFVLITGANSGLGLGASKRLLDEFLASHSGNLHLTITTRSARKSSETLGLLHQHLSRTPALKAASSARITLSSEEQDLTDLRSVLRAAARLRQSLPRLDVVVCNAGIAGAQTINWPRAVWDALTDPIHSVSWPRFATGVAGALAPKQLTGAANGEADGAGKQAQGTDPPPAQAANRREQASGRSRPAPAEPPLGLVFTANVFGHYLLVHHLAPLLCGGGGGVGGGGGSGSSSSDRPRKAPARVVWVSSLDTPHAWFSPADLQGLQTTHAYHSSKRLTDFLALTYDSPQAQACYKAFLPGAAAATAGDSPAAPAAPRPSPRIYLSHPGVAATEIYSLSLVMAFFKILSFYIARFLGSPWHTIDTYAAAISITWLALAPAAELDAEEARGGKGKWGSSKGAFGAEKVLRSEVDGYGYGGRVGDEANYAGKRRAGRRRDTTDATNRSLEDFFERVGRV